MRKRNVGDLKDERMTQDLIRYDVLVQDALRGVVKKIIGEVVKTGLPGQHHFYVTFDTHHPGVRMSTRLRQRYPDEMTVVLQHQFWDLNVSDVAFEVGLSFSGIPERLYVPLNSIKGFFDPSVQFGLQFEPVREGEPAASETSGDASPPQGTATAGNVVQSLPARAGVLRLADSDSASSKAGETGASRPGGDASLTDRTAKPSLKSVPTGPEPAEQPGGATVVSIDSFRKKP
jgi:hypothetical protein